MSTDDTDFKTDDTDCLRNTLSVESFENLCNLCLSGEDRVHGLVVRLMRQAIEQLEGKAQSHRLGGTRKARQQPVEVPVAVSQPVPGAVKRQSRHHDEVHVLG